MDKKEKRQLEDFHKKLLAESWVIMEDEVREKDKEIVELKVRQFQSKFEYDRKVSKLERSIRILGIGQDELAIDEKEWDTENFQKIIMVKFQKIIQKEIKKNSERVTELKKKQVQRISKYKRKIYEEVMNSKNILMEEREKIEELIKVNDQKNNKIQWQNEKIAEINKEFNILKKESEGIVESQKLKVKRQNEKIPEIQEELNIFKKQSEGTAGKNKELSDMVKSLEAKVEERDKEHAESKSILRKERENYDKKIKELLKVNNQKDEEIKGQSEKIDQVLENLNKHQKEKDNIIGESKKFSDMAESLKIRIKDGNRKLAESQNILIKEKENHIKIISQKDDEIKEQSEKLVEIKKKSDIAKIRRDDAEYIADGIREIKSKVKDKIIRGCK